MNPQWLKAGEVAQLLGTSRNKLFEKMRKKNILRKNNQPYPQYINAQTFKLITYQKYNNSGDLLMVTTTIRINSNQILVLSKLLR
jgi:phage antirepressor YoqD-like protein